MSNPELVGPDAEATRYARCMYVKELLYPWSIRKLATRTGLTKAAVESIYSGTRDINMTDVEVLAPVLRMTPEDLFTKLLYMESEPSAPAPQAVGGGNKLVGGGNLIPFIGSKVGPAGIEPTTSTV